ncbi:MAG: hypothetical protein JRE70_05855 [Deltaproteobacteria bacterium]|nr:hypothetical protein [Deltaproteobacteria bacterium]
MRDPDRGYVGLAYDFTRSNLEIHFLIQSFFPPPSFVSGLSRRQSDSHALRLIGGVYDRELDLELLIEWNTSTSESTLLFSGFSEIPGPTMTYNGYVVAGGAAFYPGASDRWWVGLDLIWSQTITLTAADPKLFLARFGVEWLPDLLGNRWVRLGLAANVGAVIDGPVIGAPPGQVDTDGTYRFGVTLAFDLPGAGSLKKLYREQRLR